MVGYVLIKYFKYQNPKKRWKYFENRNWIDFHLILHKITVELKEVCMKREFFIFDRLSVKKIKFRSNKNFRPNWHFFWRFSTNKEFLWRAFNQELPEKSIFWPKLRKKQQKMAKSYSNIWKIWFTKSGVWNFEKVY